MNCNEVPHGVSNANLFVHLDDVPTAQQFNLVTSLNLTPSLERSGPSIIEKDQRATKMVKNKMGNLADVVEVASEEKVEFIVRDGFNKTMKNTLGFVPHVEDGGSGKKSYTAMVVGASKSTTDSGKFPNATMFVIRDEDVKVEKDDPFPKIKFLERAHELLDMGIRTTIIVHLLRDTVRNLVCGKITKAITT
ncbi:hypothetical protein V6N13_055094 [Hibiscus sabdariffa]|uniref:Uncharacterized protein n=2 Tax=Hibiscus sabdariffa TaxID=183260 RepID=A0ABR2DVT3_9ROSI